MRKIFLLELICAAVILISGCATTDLRGVNNVHYQELDPMNPGRGVFIIEKYDDLYLRTQSGADIFFRTKHIDRRLTNTPNVTKTDVRPWWNSGCITYFAKDDNGGHWYMQPLNGDDSSKKEISPEDIMKMGK